MGRVTWWFPVISCHRGGELHIIGHYYLFIFILGHWTLPVFHTTCVFSLEKRGSSRMVPQSFFAAIFSNLRLIWAKYLILWCKSVRDKSRLRDTITQTWYYHVCVILCITSAWYFILGMFLTQKKISGRGALFRSLQHSVYTF